MKLTVFTPTGTLLQCKIKQITAETLNGHYTILPKHIDMAAAMEANIAVYITEDMEKKYLACYRGILVKKGENVTITVQNAVIGDDIDELIKTIDLDFKQNEQQRKKLNTAIARLEMGVIRGLENLHQGGLYG